MPAATIDITAWWRAALRRPEPDIAEAAASIEPVIRGANRASDIVRRIRAMAQKPEPKYVQIAVDDLARRKHRSRTASGRRCQDDRTIAADGGGLGAELWSCPNRALRGARALNPRIRVSLYDNSGHAPFLEEPQRFNRDLENFVSTANR